ncbi:MAG: hypothetical protein UZ03_NOB001000009 [Nitrospira sp. OLB3]|nr:MAG: hypothetical protein UZ03_NOB001000009 [Nitrospira sp. OLB3]
MPAPYWCSMLTLLYCPPVRCTSASCTNCSLIFSMMRWCWRSIMAVRSTCPSWASSMMVCPLSCSAQAGWLWAVACKSAGAADAIENTPRQTEGSITPNMYRRAARAFRCFIFRGPLRPDLIDLPPLETIIASLQNDVRGAGSKGACTVIRWNAQEAGPSGPLMMFAAAAWPPQAQARHGPRLGTRRNQEATIRPRTCRCTYKDGRGLSNFRSFSPPSRMAMNVGFLE